MIKLKLIPDGAATVPAEARDHGRLWDLIESNTTQAERDTFTEQTPVDGPRDIRRVVPGHGEYIALRLPGDLSEYPDDLLTATEKFVTDDIPGLKAHYRGWQNVEEREP